MTYAAVEIRRADRFARVAVAAAALGLLAAGLLTVVQKAIAVPELTKGILRDETTVVIETVPMTPAKESLVEHLADASDVKVEAKPEPVKEETPSPPPPEAPKVIEEPKPKPVVKKPPVKKKPVKKDLPVDKTEVKASDGAKASTALSGGNSASPAQGTASGTSADAQNAALAKIVAVIDEHKRYPRRARQTGAEGDVVLAVTIDGNGIVTGVVLKKPHASVLLNRAALKAAEPLIGVKLPLSAPLTVEVPVRFTIS